MLRLVCPSLRTVVSVSALSLAGCQSLTSVDAPDVIEAEDFGSAAGASALAAGAITRFHQAFGGLGDSQVWVSGLMSDELTETGSDDHWDLRKTQDPSSSTEPYGALHEARQRLLSAIGSFQQVAPDSSARIGQLFSLLGYTSVFFGENFCAGVPLSHRDPELRPVYGEPLTTAQLFDSAFTAFDSALIYGADSARIVHLAQTGRGRALLNQGRFGEAAQVVASVPTEYVYQVSYVDVLFLNNGFNFIHPSGEANTGFTVPEDEGVNGLNWRTAAGASPDPRTPLTDRNQVVGGVPLWGYTTYEQPTAPIPLAGGIEARLIEAEAALHAADITTWLARHNALRATVAGLDPLGDPGTEAARVDLHFQERAFWLFLTGHRHGDLRRLVRQYGRGAETVFPTGEWRDGVAYGAATSMALPATEGPNPHYRGCLNREA